MTNAAGRTATPRTSASRRRGPTNCVPSPAPRCIERARQLLEAPRRFFVTPQRELPDRPRHGKSRWEFAAAGERTPRKFPRCPRARLDRSPSASSDRAKSRRRSARLRQLDENGAKAPSGLLRLLNDENADTRLKAAWALGQIQDSGALPAIRDALRTEKNDHVRRGLIRALMKSGERSEAALTELLNSSDAHVREAAVRGLTGRNAFDPWPWPWPRPRPFP